MNYLRRSTIECDYRRNEVVVHQVCCGGRQRANETVKTQPPIKSLRAPQYSGHRARRSAAKTAPFRVRWHHSCSLVGHSRWSSDHDIVLRGATETLWNGNQSRSRRIGRSTTDITRSRHRRNPV